MPTSVCSLFSVGLLFCSAAMGQALSPKWEELTGPDFPKALEQARGVCVSAVRDYREAWAERAAWDRSVKRPLLNGPCGKAGVRDCISGILFRSDL